MTTPNNATNFPLDFLPLINQNCDKNGWLDTDLIKDKYPGFKFSSSCSDQVIFTNNDDDSYIIEVLGQRARECKNEQNVLIQKTIAVLQDSDSDLYLKLQWLHAGRHHGTVQWAKMMVSAMIWIPLFIVHLIIGNFIYWRPSFLSILLIMISSALLAAFEIIATIAIKRLTRVLYGFLDVSFTICKNIFKDKTKNRAYYQQLFQTLSLANCRDKAKAAKFMAKIL